VEEPSSDSDCRDARKGSELSYGCMVSLGSVLWSL
jgi:hypothetical protein